MPKILLIDTVAQICHEANAELCRAVNNDHTQPSWDDAPGWQRASARLGVEFHLSHPDASPAASHESWMAQKQKEGWTYGLFKNPEAKEHPCMVPFEDLPPEQQMKDHLFRGIVHALRPFMVD
jgi:hypothetical protein